MIILLQTVSHSVSQADSAATTEAHADPAGVHQMFGPTTKAHNSSDATTKGHNDFAAPLGHGGGGSYWF
jgi:hypothetical protein